MKYLWLLLFFFCGITTSAQTDFTRIYYTIINEAELAIVDTNYHEALQFYKEAFANVEKPFAKDYYNAAICATIVGKMPVTFDYLERIIEKGYLVENFRKDSFFKQIADTCRQWKDFEKRASLIKPTFNIALRDTLLKIAQSANKFNYAPLTTDLRNYHKNNTKPTKWFVVDSLVNSPDMPMHLRSQTDSLRKVNESILITSSNEKLHRLLRFIDQNGYPDENTIGLNPAMPAENNPLFNPSSYSLLENTIARNILLNSDIRQKTNNAEILSLVKQAIRDGKANPSILKSLINYSFEDPLTLGKVSILQLRLENNMNCPNHNWEENKEKFFWKKERPTTLSEAEINEKRINAGLEKLEDAYKKSFFKARITPFIITGGSYQAELAYIPNCELVDNLLRGTVVLR